MGRDGVRRTCAARAAEGCGAADLACAVAHGRQGHPARLLPVPLRPRAARPVPGPHKRARARERGGGLSDGAFRAIPGPLVRGKETPPSTPARAAHRRQARLAPAPALLADPPPTTAPERIIPPPRPAPIKPPRQPPVRKLFPSREGSGGEEGAAGWEGGGAGGDADRTWRKNSSVTRMAHFLATANGFST